MIEILAPSIGLAYAVASVMSARWAYRDEFRKVYGTPAPLVYGGKVGRAKADEVAMREAYWWLIFWPFFLFWSGMQLMIANGPEFRRSRIDEEIRDLEAENLVSTEIILPEKCRHQLEPRRCVVCSTPPGVPSQALYEEIKYGPLDRTVNDQSVTYGPDPCPCGYRTECVIHCGNGACHEEMTRSRDDLERGCVLHVVHPEVLGVYDVGTVADPDKKIFTIEPPSPGVLYER